MITHSFSLWTRNTCDSSWPLGTLNSKKNKKHFVECVHPNPGEHLWFLTPLNNANASIWPFHLQARARPLLLADLDPPEIMRSHDLINTSAVKYDSVHYLQDKLTVAPATPWGPGSPSRPRTPCQKINKKQCRDNLSGSCFWKMYTWVIVTDTMTKCLPSPPLSRSSPSPHESPEDPGLSNRCNRCQRLWWRNEHRVVSAWYTQHLTVGPWVPNSPGLPCSPSSPWLKMRGKRKKWKELKRRNTKLAEQWDLASLYTRTNGGQAATLLAAARSPSLNGEAQQPTLIGLKIPSL